MSLESDRFFPHSFHRAPQPPHPYDLGIEEMWRQLYEGQLPIDNILRCQIPLFTPDLTCISPSQPVVMIRFVTLASGITVMPCDVPTHNLTGGNVVVTTPPFQASGFVYAPAPGEEYDGCIVVRGLSLVPSLERDLLELLELN